MAKLNVVDVEGKVVRDIELADSIFGIEPNEFAVQAVVKNYLANQRQGTQSAKTRAEVRGGGRKPFRQKGTGRHRQGSSTDPSQIGGGIVFAPKPRSYRYSLNKKLKRLAGALAAGTYPSRVFKGNKAPGRMGRDTVTVQNVVLVKKLEDRNIMMVKGAVPGKKGGLVKIRPAVKGQDK